MLLKHPASYKHQVAFTFPGTRRSLYRRTRELLRQDSDIQQGCKEYGIPLTKDTVFFENDWNSKTPREFYDAYRDAVLVVILFDEQYLQSGGAYPEWNIIQDLKTQLHGRVIPVNLSRGADAPIREPTFSAVRRLICSEA